MGKEFVRGELDDPSLPARILTPQRMLDLIMRRSLAPHRFRCVIDGEDIHPQRYIRMNSTRRGHSVPVADMDRIGRLVESGCTLILDQANFYDPTLEVVCRALQWWSGQSLQVNLYLTTGTAEGFELHWDDHDVIVVQLAGEKTWEVRGQSRQAPLFRDAEPNFEPSDEIVWTGVLREGEAMCIPRGYWHRATRNDLGQGFSLHASFGLHKRSGADWLAWIADESRSDELFRIDLTRSLHPLVRERQEDRLNAAACQLIGNRPVTDFLSSRARLCAPSRHVNTLGTFGRPTAVVCITEYPPEMDSDEKTITVAAAARRVTIDKNLLPAVEMLLSGHPVRLEDIELKTGIDPRSLASTFLDEDICAEATPELLAGYEGLVS
ncbi:cupin domain-containing protein [Actinocrispum wychmicini]|uniref:cupin domain-containing protein n=1 Tax=Actinocrispum wychmicini TaxID=1213861 RepID=UPI001FB5CC52|nr:cupin domain-containing protein [Actinocrispum wychmicini]